MTAPTRRECYAPPTRRELRMALVRAAAAGKRRQWWAAEKAAAAFDAVRREQPCLPDPEEKT